MYHWRGAYTSSEGLGKYKMGKPAFTSTNFPTLMKKIEAADERNYKVYEIK